MTSKKPPTTPFASGCKGCGSVEIKSRGLCPLCYRRFMRELKKCPTTESKAKCEADAIAAGWITEPTKGGRPKKDVPDPFEKLFQEYLASDAAEKAKKAAKELSQNPRKQDKDAQ